MTIHHTKESMGLLAQITKGLLARSQNMKKDLGDRSSYIGMSDIGRGMECLRAAVADKFQKATSSEEVARWYAQEDTEKILGTLQRELVFQRGHWFESGLGEVLQSNGSKSIHQLEVAIVNDGIPVKAHLDFTLAWGGEKPAVRILEVKSTEHVPASLYSSYETQLYGQLGIVSAYWDQPCFSTKNHKNLTFPEIALKELGVRMPDTSDSVDIQGWVLCLNMSEVKPFGPYRPDYLLWGICEKVAHRIWERMHTYQSGLIRLNDVEHCKGFHPLCDWCDHAVGCPKFTIQSVHDLACNDQFLLLEELKAKKTALDMEIRDQESRIRRTYHLMHPEGNWLDTGDFRFRVAIVNGRNSLDKTLLEAELAAFMSAGEVQALLQRASKTADPHERLYINRNKKEKAA